MKNKLYIGLLGTAFFCSAITACVNFKPKPKPIYKNTAYIQDISPESEIPNPLDGRNGRNGTGLGNGENGENGRSSSTSKPGDGGRGGDSLWGNGGNGGNGGDAT